MLLKVGVAMMVLSLALATAVAATVKLGSGSRAEPASSVEPRSTEVAPAEKEEEAFDPGELLKIDEKSDAEPESQPERPAPEEPRAEEPRPERPRPAGPRPAEPRPAEPRPEAPSSKGLRPAAFEVPDWPEPTEGEAASAEEPRYYEPTPDTGMTLTIPALGLYDVPVIDSPDYEVLDRGLMHEPETSLPWDGGAQRNVFVAGHYLGWPGTQSHLVFYNLDKLEGGDEILVRGNGGAYRYRVAESFEAGPDESWVMGQVRGRDMLTLQTCVPPNFEDRLIVRADRV